MDRNRKSLAAAVERIRSTSSRARVLVVLGLAALLTAVIILADPVDNFSFFKLGDGLDTPGSATIAATGSLANGPNWGDLFTSTGALKDVQPVLGRPDYRDFGGIGAAFTHDDLSTGSLVDHTIFTAGKFNDPVSAWTWGTGNVPAKDDIRNAYLYAVKNPVVSSDGTNHLMLYAGLERVVDNGDAHISFHLSQQYITPNSSGGFDGSRTVGDLAVSMDFSNGGTLGSVTVYKWNGSIYDQVQAVGGEGCNTDHTVCAFNNGVPITGIQGDAIDVNAFTEIGVDVTALIPNGGALPCFPDVMFVSRSSQSTTATLKDFAASSIKLCGLAVLKQCSDAISGQNISFTGSIRNVGAVPLTGLTVGDDQPGSLILPLAKTTLQPGEAVSYTGSYAPVGLGSVTDTVTATAHAYTVAGDTVVATGQATCKVVDTAALTVTKACTAGTPNDPVYFGGTITNTGTVIVSGISIIDDQPASVINPLSTDTLVPGSSVNYAGYYPALEPGSQADTVHVTGNATVTGGVNAFASASCNVNSPPLLTKTFTDIFISLGATTDLMFNIVNPNGVPLTGVGFSDTFPSGIVTDSPLVLIGSCGGGSISTTTNSIALSGATLPPLGSCTFGVKVAGTSLGLKHNVTGNVTSNEGGAGGKASADVTVQQGAVIIHKTSDATPATTVGSTITYSFTVTNTGTLTITGLSVTDSKLGAVTCPVTTLSPGGSTTCTKTYVVTQADLDNGSIYNKVIVTGSTPAGAVLGHDDLTVTLVQNPGLNLVKSAAPAFSSPATAGDPITYTFSITNTGNVTLKSVNLTDALVGYSNATCSTTTLASGATATCSATYHITQADIDRGSVTNSAKACGTPNACSTDTKNVQIPQSPALSATKQCTDAVGEGGLITFSGTIANTGNVTLNNVSASDAMPSGSTNASTIAVGAASLAPGQSTTYSGSYVPPALGGDQQDTITASATAPNGGAVTAQATAKCKVVTAPAIQVTKQCTDAPKPGQPILFSGTITNSGNVTLNISVTDAAPAGSTNVSSITLGASSLAPGASTTYGGSYTPPQTGGPQQDTVTASGVDGINGGTVTAQASASCAIATNPSILVTKACTNTIPGGLINFSGTISNTGDVTLNGLSVSDFIPAGSTNVSSITLGVSSLAAGANTTYSGSYTPPQTAGPQADSVTASGVDAINGGSVTVSANASCSIVTAPAITITQVCTNASAPGQPILYSGIVTNTGNVTLNPISLNGVYPSGSTSISATTLGASVLAPGQSTTYSASYVPPQTAGAMTDTIAASGVDAIYGPPAVTASASATCTTPVQISTLTYGRSMGFWGNRNGQALLYAAGYPSVNIGRGGIIDSQPESQKVLPSTLNACGKGTPIIFSNQTTTTNCTLATGINVGTLNTAASQTLALGYNQQLISGYVGQTIGTLGCSAYVTAGLSAASSVTDAFNAAVSQINGSASGGTTSQPQLGAMNQLLSCLNREP